MAAHARLNAPRPVTWQQSLEALLPDAASSGRAGATTAATPLGIELDLTTGPGPSRLEARVVRPGKRGGWVSGDVNWSVLFRLAHYGYAREHIEALRIIYALSQASGSGVPELLVYPLRERRRST